MALTTSFAKILTSSGRYAYLSNVEKRISILNPEKFSVSGRKFNAGFIATSGQRWNPLLNASPNVSRRGMRIRGSQLDGGVADGSFIPQYDETSETKSAFQNGSEPDHEQSVQRPSASAAIPPVQQRSLSQRIEDRIERAIFDCRFLTLFGVVGSLLGSMLCFLQGSLYVGHSFREYIRASILNVRSSHVILYLVEAVDVYLMGTVMLIFGMGLYELFVSSLDIPGKTAESGASTSGKTKTIRSSNFFGLFTLEERPKWLEVRSLDELKTKLGHVIVMILLVGMFEKSKRVPIHSGLDLLLFSGSIFLASSCLYLLSMLHHSSSHGNGH